MPIPCGVASLSNQNVFPQEVSHVHVFNAEHDHVQLVRHKCQLSA
jgi:hypothetical protein